MCEQCHAGAWFIVRGKCKCCGWIQGAALVTELLAPL